MTAQIAAYGRLVADPQLKTTSKGTQMTMASMAVPLPCSQADDGTATMWLPVVWVVRVTPRFWGLLAIPK